MIHDHRRLNAEAGQPHYGSKHETFIAATIRPGNQRTFRMHTKLALAFMASLATGGCASIIHGTSQEVGISSSPSGAEVSINGVPSGQTPVVADLSRKKNHSVSIKMPGYHTADLTLTKGVSGWVWGNIVFGGLPGLAVDAITGGLYKLTPEQLNSQLRKSSTSVSDNRNDLHILTVLEPDVGWRRIGSLAPRTD